MYLTAAGVCFGAASDPGNAQSRTMLRVGRTR